MKILYVEDNPANLSLLQRIARMGGHEVVSYTEGESALRNYEKDKPDLVLMDVQLSGGMNGLDVVRKLRERGHKTPIIAVTAYAMTGDRERCIEAGCDTYIAKPLPVAELVEMVKVFEEKIKKGIPAAAPKPAAAAPESAPPDLKEPQSPAATTAPSAAPAPATPAAPAASATPAPATPSAPPAPATPAAPAASTPAPTPAVTPSAPVTPAVSPSVPASTPPTADDKTTPASPMAGKTGTSSGTTPSGGTSTIASTVK